MLAALGTSVRLAASLSLSSPSSAPSLTVTALSIYDWASSRGQMSPTWDSASPFVIAEPDDWCMCMCVKEKEGEGEK